MLEAQRDQLCNQQFNMEQTSFALESVKDSVATVQAMKAAGAELKTAMKDKNLVREEEMFFSCCFFRVGARCEEVETKLSPFFSFPSLYPSVPPNTNKNTNRTSPASSPSRTTWQT